MKTQIVKNIISNYVVSILSIGIGFALVPFLIGKLGKESFGLISLVDSTIIFFEVATVSVRTALARSATYTLAQGKTEDFLDYLGTGRILLFFSSLIVLIAGAVITYFFPVFFKVPAGLEFQSQLLFLMVCISFTISIPNIVFWSVLYAKQRYDLINSSMSFGTLAKAGTLFLLFSTLPHKHVNLVVYGLVYIFFTWAQNTLIVFFSRRIYPEARWSLRHFNPKKIREILSFSVYTSIQRLASLFVANTTNILINIFYGPAANAIYAVSTKLPMIMRRIFTESTWSLTPTFTELAAKKDQVRLEKLFFMYTRLLISAASPLCCLVLLFGKQLILLWVGEEFATSGDLVILFTAPLLLGIPFAVCGCIYNAFGKFKVPSYAGLCYSVFNVSLGVVLARGFGMGLHGFGYANMFSAFIYLSLFQPFYACRTASIPLGRYWTHCVLHPFLPPAVVFGSTWVCLQAGILTPQLSFFWLAKTGFLLIALSYGLSLFILNGVERETLKEFIHKMLPKKAART